MLADDVGFELLGENLGEDVRSALQAALTGRAVFPKASEPLTIFREALNASIREVETDRRGMLFQEFLSKGPYEGEGEIPQEQIGTRLSDEETASVITFIYSHMINCFKGAITELLAAGACTRLLMQLQRDGVLPSGARLHVGDAVKVRRKGGRDLLKGADMSILVAGRDSKGLDVISLVGVAEVKSYFRSKSRLREQLDRHVKRSKGGLWVAGAYYPGERVWIGHGPARRIVRIVVLPDDWKLPRTYRFETAGERRLLHVDDGHPVRAEDEIVQTGKDEWRITLRWSKEALAAVAYEMTFWYMEKVGEVIYSKEKPKEWSEMNPAEAGRNAAKMMLYYAILRCKTARENQRAIALYNSYGFGYALGMNFVNAEGRREMLWPEDLDEILAQGRTKYDCRIL